MREKGDGRLFLASGASTQLVRLEGIEPSIPDWKSEVLPLNYSRDQALAFVPIRAGQAFALSIGGLKQANFLQNGEGKGVAAFLSLALIEPHGIHFLSPIRQGIVSPVPTERPPQF